MEAWPDDFRCPITLEVMTDPVIIPSGHTFERRSIQRWLDGGHLTCPVTNLPLPPSPPLIPNHALRRLISAVSPSAAAAAAPVSVPSEGGAPARREAAPAAQPASPVPELLRLAKSGAAGRREVLALLARCREGRQELCRIPGVVSVLTGAARSGNARAIEQALLVLIWICSESNELALEAIKLEAFQLCEALVNDDNCKIAKNAVELARTLEKA
ncbi:hypothetical protein BS78_07G038000 [Paspalum vaginatum]|nr:hypothetical protein BS78_07G038000 [Paspalum vaginatum]